MRETSVPSRRPDCAQSRACRADAPPPASPRNEAQLVEMFGVFGQALRNRRLPANFASASRIVTIFFGPVIFGARRKDEIAFDGVAKPTLRRDRFHTTTRGLKTRGNTRDSGRPIWRRRRRESLRIPSGNHGRCAVRASDLLLGSFGLLMAASFRIGGSKRCTAVLSLLLLSRCSECDRALPLERRRPGGAPQDKAGR
jgi:hypothetical protein